MSMVMTPGIASSDIDVSAETAAAATSGIPDTADIDTLLASVLYLCQHHGLARSPHALCAGLPKEGVMLPSVALQALDNAGLSATIVKRRLDQLASLLLPVILLRGCGGACVLLGRQAAQQPGRSWCYTVLLPEFGSTPLTLQGNELDALYGGYALLARPRPKSGAAAAAHGDASATSGSSDAHNGSQQSAGHWLGANLWRYRGHYANAALGALLINVLALATTFFTMNVYDRVVPNQAITTLWSLAIGVGLAMLMEFVARHLRAHLLDQAGKKVDLVVGAILFRQAMAIRMEDKPASAGAFAAQLREFESLRDFASAVTLSVLTDLPFVFMFIALAFFVGGELGLVPLMVLPLIALLGLAVQGPLARAMRENLRESSHKQGLLIEMVEGLETLKAVGGEGQAQQRWETMSALSAASVMKVRHLSSLALHGVSLLQQVQTVVIIVWGVYLIGAGLLTQGALIGTVILAGRAAAPLGQLAGLALRFQQARAALQVLDGLMRLVPERAPARRYLSLAALSGQISLRDVGLRYPAPPGRPAPLVLEHVDLSLGATERVAVLGTIGSGKSSLLRLIAGLYRPSHGSVLADGIDASQIDPADWRRAIAYVGQDCRLFHGSLWQNLIIGRPDASDQELLAVLQLVGLDRLVKAHPQGVHLPVGEMGQALSAGQRQLVALARGLLGRPRLLLLDEPTSAMDSQSEAHFITRLAQATQGQAIVLVTHRPALLALVDRIVVLDQGRIVADGPRQQVLASLSAARTGGQS